MSNRRLRVLLGSAVLTSSLLHGPLHATNLGLTAGTHTLFLDCLIIGSTTLPCTDVTGTVSVDATSVLDWSFTVNGYLFSWDGGVFQDATFATEFDSQTMPSRSWELRLSATGDWLFDQSPGSGNLQRSGTWSVVGGPGPGAVPEPGTITLVSVAAALLVWSRRRSVLRSSARINQVRGTEPHGTTAKRITV